MERNCRNLVFASLIWLFIQRGLIEGFFLDFLFIFGFGLLFIWGFVFIYFVLFDFLLFYFYHVFYCWNSPALGCPMHSSNHWWFQLDGFSLHEKHWQNHDNLKNNLSLHSSAFHSDLYFQSVSTEIFWSLSLCIHTLIFPSYYELSAIPYICICRPRSSCVAVYSKFLSLTLWGKWLDNMVAIESNNLVPVLLQKLCCTLFWILSFISKSIASQAMAQVLYDVHAVILQTCWAKSSRQINSAQYCKGIKPDELFDNCIALKAA